MTGGRQLKGDEYMKKRALFTKLTLLCAGLLFFASCSMIDSAENAALKGETASASGQSSGQKFSFSGSICVTGALPASLCRADGDSVASRSALPSYNIGSEYYYFVTATQTDGSGTFSINSFNNPSDFDTTNGVIFALSLGSGTWQIISGVKRSPTSSSVNANTDPIIMSDTYPATLSAANPVVSHIFYPKPSQSGEGTVELKISVYSEISDFGRVTASCSKSAWAEKVSEPSYDTEAGQWIIQTNPSNTLPSGTYEVTFNFYNTSNILLYSTVQTINVFDNMTTNTWLSDGSGAIDDNGTFALSNSLVTSFARTTFYVGQTSAATSVEVNASDITGNGSPYAPLETVNKAVEVIKANGDSSKDYRIFISGELSGSTEITPPFDGKARSLTLAGLNGLDSNGEPKDSLISDSTEIVLSVMTNVPVTIKNLAIKGGTTGLSVGLTGTNVIIESGVLITDCSRGVNLYANASLTMKGGKISGNIGTSEGAGVETANGTSFTFEGGEISENEATGNGGGVYIANSATFTMTGGTIKKNKAASGAGIYNSAYNTAPSSSITNGTITENEASEKGGGICNTTHSVLTVTGGEISKNTAPLGGAIHVYYASLFLGGDAYIPYGDKNGSKGAGKNDICLEKNGAHDSYITLSSGLFKHSKSNPIAVTHSEWQRGKTIVQAGTNDIDLTPYKDYFTYTQDGWGSKVSTDKKSIYIDTPIYVAGTEPEREVCTADGSDVTGEGTRAKPYATIAKAIELLTDKDTDYTIYIDGTISGVQTIPDTLKSDGTGTYNAKSLTIDGVNGLDQNNKPIDILDGNKASDSTLTVESNVPVTITNLKIINGTGKSTFKRGGGIYISDNASLALGDGALVTDNTAKDGGGIYNLGKLFLYGTAMVGMQTNSVATSDNWGNKATGEGAGIYSTAQGQIYLGYRSESETEVLTGGVCGNYNANSRAEEPGENCGGGICMSSNFESGKIEIASGNISYNYAMNGAGIYTRGHVTMTGGTIEGNEGNSADTTNGKGGGIYLYDFNTSPRTFTMSGNAVIKNNKNIALGAGVYLRNGYCTFEMNGGEISGNIALSNGGAVYMDNMNGSSSLNIQGAANIPYGGAVKNNDIYMSDTSQKIKITGPLSERDADKVIGLTPSSYTERTLLAAETGVTLADEAGKFIVTNNEWGILATGSLVNAKTATTLAATLSALPANTVENPYEILLYASSESDFETIKSILKSNSSKYVNITLYCPGFTSLPESAFISCTSLVGITLPYGITAIGEFVFAGCSNLSSLILPESLKSTSYRDLNGCTALKSIVLPDSLETIGIQSFDSTGLTSITIPKNVKTIGDDAFASSTSLAEVIVDSENQYFKAIDGVLYNKEETKLLYYPAAKTGSFVIPNSVTTIGGYSFYHSKLSNLTIPESVTSIGDRAFEACSLTSITLPNSLKTIDSEAFALCSNLTTVTIPKSVTSIYRSPFSGCSNLTEINVEEGNSKYVSVDGVLFDKDKTLLICYPAGSSATSYTIPNTVKKIGTYAFNRCSKLTSITISDSVDYINSYGIYSCTSLSSIIFTDTTTWYKTSKYTYTDGEVVDFTDSAANVATINNSQNTYWYKE